MAEPAHRLPGATLAHVTSIGKAVGEPLRASILQVLKEDSFAVSELCSVLDVPQPALSHHLKVLHRAGLVARRREGTSIFYRRRRLPGDALSQSLFEALDECPVSSRARRAMARVHTARRNRCRQFFARHASEIASLHREIADPEAYVGPVLAMVDRLIGPRPSGAALEVGPGEGELLRGLADRYQQAVGVDSSAEMLAQTARNTHAVRKVRLEHHDYFELPGADYQLIVAAMVVHHLPSPAAFFQQSRRLLGSGGSLIVVELCRHDQQWASEHCGDQWLGFEAQELSRWAALAGLEPAESEFLAQNNGFQIQLQRYVPAAPTTRKETT